MPPAVTNERNAPMNLLPTNLAPLADIADPNEGTRWAVTGVQLESFTDGTGWRATATDCKRMVRVSGPDITKADDYPDLPGMNAAPNGAMKALIPASRWKDFFRNAAKLTKKAKPALRAVAVKMGPDRVTLGATDGDDQPLTQTPTVEGRFPPINDIMPKKFGVGLAVVNIDPALFAETLGAIAKMMDPERGEPVTMEIFGPDRPIHFSAEGANGTKIESILMPMGNTHYDPVAKLKRVIGKLFRRRNVNIAVKKIDYPMIESHERMKARALKVEAEVELLRAENERLVKANRKLRLKEAEASLKATQREKSVPVQPQTRAERLALRKAV